jgi:hypothetical protein
MRQTTYSLRHSNTHKHEITDSENIVIFSMNTQEKCSGSCFEQCNNPRICGAVTENVDISDGLTSRIPSETLLA